MAITIINQMGALAADAVRAGYPDVEIVDFTGGDMPSGLRADVFFGGYAGWDGPLEWIDAAGVRWVQLSGTGVDQLPDAVYGNDRLVTCARGASAVPISEWVMAAVLAHAKRFPDIFLSEPPKHWNFPSPTFDSVSGSTLALVGLGGIGGAVASRALAFDMRVKALRRTDAPSPVPGVAIVTSIEELVADADHLVLAAPATARTAHLISSAVLDSVKPGLHLVNIARGALVDQDALRVALDDGRVVMATLDTVSPEPLPEGHWMYSHPRVRLAAHVSWYNPTLLGEAVSIFVENLGRFVRGEPLLHVVDRDEGY
jgi:phosphoglycerate dehydrogenase-like enzyme